MINIIMSQEKLIDLIERIQEKLTSTNQTLETMRVELLNMRLRSGDKVTGASSKLTEEIRVENQMYHLDQELGECADAVRKLDIQ